MAGRASASFELKGNRLALLRAAFSLANRVTLHFAKAQIVVNASEEGPASGPPDEAGIAAQS
jgi:hypothetical protein